MTTRIQLNGEVRELVAETTLSALLAQFGFPDKLIAVELNGAVVRRADWPKTIVLDDDKIEVVHFVGGG